MQSSSLLSVAIQHHRAGRYAEAERHYRQVLALDPGHADALHLLGVLALQTRRADQAVQLIGKAIAVDGAVAEYHFNLGLALRSQQRLDEAVASYRRAVALQPGYPQAWNNLGNALKDLRNLDGAADALTHAVALKPDYAEAHNNLGVVLRGQNRLEEAVASHRRALALKAAYPDAISNLGLARQDQGRLDEAVAFYRRALALKPDLLGAHTNLVMGLHYAEAPSNADRLAEARALARKMERPPVPRAYLNPPDAGRRLRIGYVSGDLRSHPVGYFLARPLAARDRGDSAVICYSNSVTEDDLTARLRAGADGWRAIVGLSDGDAAQMIAQDGIDILVDLSGHTARNRLPLFALRPAPVQATWLGYFGTTGLSAMDYVLADRFVIPAGDEPWFTEAVVRLPDSYLCFDPPDIAVAVGPAPMAASGFVTFGCFNNRTKLSQGAIALWSRILAAVPGSRLLLKTKALADDSVSRNLLGAFGAHGIAPDRLVLEAPSPMAEYLAAYNRVDIALDPFPFGGGATTAQALWMGAPVVTLRGDRWAGRMSESFLAAIGVPELVADDPDHYLAIATALAADPPRLAALRASLRSRMEASPFCDGARFARNLDAAYRAMWQAWCTAARG